MTSGKHLVALAVALAVLLLPAGAIAEGDPPFEDTSVPLHIVSASDVVTDGGSLLRLPPGYFLDEPMWLRFDTEIRRLQDAETRLAAENESLRESVSRAPPGGWRTMVLVAGALAAGIAIGVSASK